MSAMQLVVQKTRRAERGNGGYVCAGRENARRIHAAAGIE